MMEEKPPVFQSWSAWYKLVIGIMLVQLIVYSFITHLFS